MNPDINTTQTILLTENTNGYLYEIQLSPFCNLVEAEYRCSDSTLEITFQDTEGEIMGKLGSSLQSQKTHFDTPSDHHIIMTVSPHQDDCIITIDEYINKVE